MDIPVGKRIELTANMPSKKRWHPENKKLVDGYILYYLGSYRDNAHRTSAYDKFHLICVIKNTADEQLSHVVTNTWGQEQNISYLMAHQKLEAKGIFTNLVNTGKVLGLVWITELEISEFYLFPEYNGLSQEEIQKMKLIKKIKSLWEKSNYYKKYVVKDIGST